MELTLQEAIEEFNQLKEWLEDFQKRQQLQTQYLMRANYLDGFISGQTQQKAAQNIVEPREGDESDA